MNLYNISYKKEILSLFLQRLQKDNPIPNLSLNLEEKGSIYESMFSFNKNRINIVGLNTSSIQKLLWVLAHEYRHAQQFQKPMKIYRISKVKMTIFILLLLTNFALIQLNPEYSNILMNLGIIQILFIGHFLSDNNHEDNTVFLELDADHFANKTIGGGAMDMNEFLVIFRSFGCLFSYILGFQTHPIFYLRYKKSLGYPFKPEILVDLCCERDSQKDK